MVISNSAISPLVFSRSLLSAAGTRLFSYHQDRIPIDSPLLVVSNHRSFMDAPILMAALNRTVRFACHHYMGQVPLLREIVARLGGFPLESPDQRQHAFFEQASELLQHQQAVGIFPEGAQPMIQLTEPLEVTPFQRGFAHLALRAPTTNLAILPVAIASQSEMTNLGFPLQFLSLFDPSEPLFKQSGWHPMVIYQRVHVLIGHPIWITNDQRQQYQGKQAKTAVTALVARCEHEIDSMLCPFK